MFRHLEAATNNYVIIVVSKFMTYLRVSRVSLFPQLIKQSNKRWLSFTSHIGLISHTPCNDARTKGANIKIDNVSR